MHCIYLYIQISLEKLSKKWNLSDCFSTLPSALMMNFYSYLNRALCSIVNFLLSCTILDSFVEIHNKNRILIHLSLLLQCSLIIYSRYQFLLSL